MQIADLALHYRSMAKKSDTGDAIAEIQAFFKKTGKTIIALTVKDILDEQIAYKLA